MQLTCKPPVCSEATGGAERDVLAKLDDFVCGIAYDSAQAAPGCVLNSLLHIHVSL